MSHSRTLSGPDRYEQDLGSRSDSDHPLRVFFFFCWHATYEALQVA